MESAAVAANCRQITTCPSSRCASSSTRLRTSLPRAVVAASRAGRVQIGRPDRRSDSGARARFAALIRLAQRYRSCDALLARDRCSPRMKALVTGATGFVGAAVARALLRSINGKFACWRARGSDRRNLKGLDVEVVEGDLTDVKSLQRAAAGLRRAVPRCRGLSAGRARSRAVVSSQCRRNSQCLECARTAQACSASSTPAVSPPSAFRPTARRAMNRRRTRSTNMIGHYKRSKYLAEEVVREAARDGTSVVIVSPSTPVGPGDVKPTPTGQLVLDAGGRQNACLCRYGIEYRPRR